MRIPTRVVSLACVLCPGLGCFVATDDILDDEIGDQGTAAESGSETAGGSETTGAETTDEGSDTTELSDTEDTEPLCGNGVIDLGEECDGDNFAGNSCETLGYDSGELTCDMADCSLDLEGCEVCVLEPECLELKPNVAIVLDYSTSMNTLWDMRNNLTRWQVVVGGLEARFGLDTWFSLNTHLSLMRFGHDPSLDPGTLIPNDDSGISDGQKLDVPWYDAQTTPWYECNGAGVNESLNSIAAPNDGSLVGIGTWTKGAMDATAIQIADAKADHAGDLDQRIYINILVTDGAWTSMDGTTVLAPASENPAITVTDLFINQAVRTYVIVVGGDPSAEQVGDSLASAGGTVAAFDANTVSEFDQRLAEVQADIEGLADPVCP